MLRLFNDMDNMFNWMDAMFNYQLPSIGNRGLKPIISRPHNLITKRDENGKVTGYAIEVVYTPFRKDEVKVEVEDHNLTVRCGAENKVKDDNMDYCGISYQSYKFTIPLANDIDENAIDAKAEDGILKIQLPVKKVEEKATPVIAIEVK